MHNALFAHFVILQATAADAAGQLDPWKVVLGASPIVQLVLILLVIMSLACWFVIGVKAVRVVQATRTSRKFLDLFWSGEQDAPWTSQRLEGVYAQLRSFDGLPVAAVFRSGYVELARTMSVRAPADATIRDGYPSPPTGADNVERALRRTAGNEMTSLEGMLIFLATTGSTAPFIGLFGTVWGIMSTFIAMHGQDKNLDVVLPHIAEALIATAVGLAAAIPAVMAYNYFVRRMRVIESEVDSFAHDYLNIVRRHFLRG